MFSKIGFIEYISSLTKLGGNYDSYKCKNNGNFEKGNDKRRIKRNRVYCCDS